MYLLIIFCPLISFLLISFFGRFVGREGSSFIVVFFMFFTTLLSWLAFFEIAVSKSIITLTLFDWINLGSVSIS